MVANDPFGQIDKRELDELAKPFPLDVISWRPIRWNRENNAAIAYAYVDPRAVMNRLEDVFPGGWNLDTNIIKVTDFKAIQKAIITINGISRSGHGEHAVSFGESEKGKTYINQEPWKSAESDAIKRAAAAFGVGRYLYELPAVWIPWEGDREYGHFAVDPASIVFSATGEVNEEAVSKDTKRGRGRPATKKTAAGPVVPGIPSSVVDQKSASPITIPVAPTPAQPVSAPVAPTPTVAPIAAPAVPGMPSSAGIDQNQYAWIASLYAVANQEVPVEIASMTRKSAAEWIHNAIKAGGNAHAPTASQIEIISKMLTQLSAGLPAELAQLTVTSASPYIQELIQAVNAAQAASK